jgi:flagellar biogenesis protein FliO
VSGLAKIGGIAGRLLERLRRAPVPARRLVLRERISLGPRQHLALVEADGRRFLIATGTDGSHAFHLLSEKPAGARISPRRVSW